MSWNGIIVLHGQVANVGDFLYDTDYEHGLDYFFFFNVRNYYYYCYYYVCH